MERQKIQVTVGSRKYMLTTDEEPERVRRVAAYADRLLRETTVAAHLAENQAAIMSMITLTDELMRSKDENARLRRELNQALERLAQK